MGSAFMLGDIVCYAVVFLAWLLYDGYASRALSGTWMDLLEVPQRETQQEPLSQSLIGPRLYWVQFIAITASLTSSLSVLGFLFGPRPFSGLKSLSDLSYWPVVGF